MVATVQSARSVFALAICGWTTLCGWPASAQAAGLDLNFVQPQATSARPWLAARKFQYQLVDGSESNVKLGLGERGLTVETSGPAEPLLTMKGLSIQQPATLTVTWGVSRFPAGANWEAGINNEAIMVIVQFGTEQLSGGFLRPPSPYFIGFFLCEKERRGVAITGRSYTQQGRYVCVDKPAAGTEVTSVINLADQFRAAFRTTGPVPAVSGIGIEADTTQVKSDGRASAWIKSIAIKN